MIKGLYIMKSDKVDIVYTKENREQIEKYVQFDKPPLTSEEVMVDLSILKDIEVIFSSWGAPKMDKTFLHAAPCLKAVFYGAGSVKNFISPEFWKRKIQLTSAYGANAVPVAEYTIAQIIISLKMGWLHMRRAKELKKHLQENFVPGAYGSTVGIISLGMIGRMIIKRLQSYDLKILAYDPFTREEDAKDLGVELVSLEELFKRSHVVSLHTPRLKETEGMINGRLFSLMKEGTTFINTARGAVVNEVEMIEVLKERSDITALLDVTFPEPPADDSPLYDMKNVFLTPHIAGSMNGECARMGFFMVEELKNYLEGKPFKWNITEEKARTMA